MQTVVEYLRENLLIGITLSNGDIEFNNHVFELAEKIEKKQVMDAWRQGYDLAVNGERIPKL